MANLRILYDNAADEATVTASSTAGTLAAANLLTDIKSEVWRSDGTTESLTLVWDDPQTCSLAALPFCNLTSTATIRARGYTNADDVVAAVDSGVVLACAYQPFGLWDWGVLPLGVNAFSYGGGAYGRVYFTATPIRKLVIDIVDIDNESGYIEAGRLVAGAYWSPEYNPSYGAEQGGGDQSRQERNDAGDLRTVRGATFRTLQLRLEQLSASDRARLYDIVRGNGMARPVFVSVFPENSADPALEQSHQIYGKLARASGIVLPSFGTYSAPLEIEEI